MSIDPTDVRFGNPPEWRAFAERHRRFLERFENLKRALNAAFIRSLKDAGALESMLFFTSRHAADDFMEILLVCGNGEAPAGQKLLRSFYERVVTIAYLHKNEAEFPKYFNYFHVTQKKVMESERALYGDDRFPPERVAEIEAEYLRVKDDYKARECGKCGRREMGPSWNKAPLHVMAKDTALDRYYHIAYTEPLLQAHAGTKGTLSRLEGGPGGPISWGKRVDRGKSDEVFATAHALLLHLLEYQVQRFKVEGLETLVGQAVQDWKDVWDPPEPDPVGDPARDPNTDPNLNPDVAPNTQARDSGPTRRLEPVVGARHSPTRARSRRRDVERDAEARHVGPQRQTAKAATEWMTREVSELRIVDDAV